MDIKDVMIAAGADYPSVLARFMGNESLLKKFVLKFPDDLTYTQIKTALMQKDAKNTHLSAHTLKGVSSNLGFDKLSLLCANVDQAARQGDMDQASIFFEEVQKEYEMLIDLIQKL